MKGDERSREVGAPLPSVLRFCKGGNDEVGGRLAHLGLGKIWVRCVGVRGIRPILRGTMTHFAEDVQFFLILAGGGSLTALSISRVKYSKDWFSPWFTMTKVTSFLAFVVIAVNERRAGPSLMGFDICWGS